MFATRRIFSSSIRTPTPLSPLSFRSRLSHNFYSTSRTNQNRQQKNRDVLYYSGSIIALFVGLSYAAVPLYELICSTTGLDGSPVTTPGSKFNPDDMKPVRGAKPIKITFHSSVNDKMKWRFAPVTKEIHVVPGETALAFFEAKNETDEDIVGISTYSVVPAKAAQYFNKIQCFCFEEQLLMAGEEVDMPVFFYIDPEFAYDPLVKDVGEITLHYTFFKSKIQPEQFGALPQAGGQTLAPLTA